MPANGFGLGDLVTLVRRVIAGNEVQVDVVSMPAVGDVGVVSYDTVICGELVGTVAAVQMPGIACKMVKFKAQHENPSNVYIGGAGVTIVNGTTDTTSGLELSAGEDTGWLTVSNLNVFYRICDSANDHLTYLALG